MNAEEERKPEHDPNEVRALLARLSREKRAVSAHLGIRVDLEHSSDLEASRIKAAKTTYFAHNDY